MDARYTCIICQGSLTSFTDDQQLLGSSSRADALYPFTLYQCNACGHIQKALDIAWQTCTRDLYEHDYKLPGRKINIVDGKIVNRESCLVGTLDKMLGLEDKGFFLDVGCGAGYLIEAFAAVKSGWIVAGQDISDSNSEQVRNSGAATFYQGPLKDIKDKFDLITLNHVAEHLTDPVSVLREAASLLKPKGHIAIVVPNFQSVHTDFFFMEHCSHFTYRTLSIAAGLAGLEVLRRIEGLKDIEIGFIAAKSEQDDRKNALDCLSWAESLPDFIRNNSAGNSAGIFGVSGAGLWLGTLLRGEISFFVDEDPSKQGQCFAGCPVVGVNDIPENSVVFVTFNNPDASLNMCRKLRLLNPKATFMAA